MLLEDGNRANARHTSRGRPDGKRGVLVRQRSRAYCNQLLRQTQLCRKELRKSDLLG